MTVRGFDPVGIVFFGGIKINSLQHTSTFAVGETFLQSLNSQSKSNSVAGQTFGDFDFNNLQPIASPLYDPDGADSFMPVAQSTLGLED